MSVCRPAAVRSEKKKNRESRCGAEEGKGEEGAEGVYYVCVSTAVDAGEDGNRNSSKEYLVCSAVANCYRQGLQVETPRLSIGRHCLTIPGACSEVALQARPITTGLV